MGGQRRAGQVVVGQEFLETNPGYVLGLGLDSVAWFVQLNGVRGISTPIYPRHVTARYRIETPVRETVHTGVIIDLKRETGGKEIEFFPRKADQPSREVYVKDVRNVPGRLEKLGGRHGADLSGLVLQYTPYQFAALSGDYDEIKRGGEGPAVPNFFLTHLEIYHRGHNNSVLEEALNRAGYGIGSFGITRLKPGEEPRIVEKIWLH